MKEILDAAYWNNRYLNDQTGWDLGEVSPPLKKIIDQLEDKSLRILIPGAGNAYEAAYLWENDFKNVFIIDIAEETKKHFVTANPQFPNSQFLTGDFFELEGYFDLILEQTFFCALDPSLRTAYAQKMYSLLNPKGILTGVMFDFPLDTGPPFGGNKVEYLSYFNTYFDVLHMEKCVDSIKPRLGRELFIKLRKRSEIKF